MKTKNLTYQPWTQSAYALLQTGKHSRREIARLLNIPRSTCLDFLRKKTA